MSDSLFDRIPGYREAVEHECEVRDVAFIDGPEFIVGIEVLPFTPRHFAVLDLCQSPFLSGETPLPEHVAQFLWAVHPQWQPKTTVRARWRRNRFVRSIRHLNYINAVAGIRGYLAEAFMDTPGGKSGPSGQSYNSFMAYLVFSIASECHWTEDAIMRIPFKRLFQYYRIIQRRGDPNAPQFNPSDKVRGDWLVKENERLQALAKN